MVDLFAHVLEETAEISLFVFIALVAMDLIYVQTKGKMAAFLTRRPQTQYLVSGLLGAIPGCEGVYFSISLHTHGLISFGALLSAFVATTGDEAYVMLAQMPATMGILSITLLTLGYLVGWGVDAFNKGKSEAHGIHCDTEIFHPYVQFSLRHYLTDHLWHHLIRKHMVKIVGWTFAAILIIEGLSRFYDVSQLVHGHPFLTILIAVLIGLIPQSGPNLIFVTMFAEGAIPFSILFTNMFVQSGHALLPLLSMSLRDSIHLKWIAAVVGLGLGGIAYLLGF